MLDPEESSEDEYYLLLNGSIFAPHHEPRMLSPGNDYCMEFVPEMGIIVVLVCFPEGSLIPREFSSNCLRFITQFLTIHSLFFYFIFYFFAEARVSTADARITFYACGLLVSVPFLVMTIVAYSITPCLMDVHGKALCHYCGCLAVAFATLAIAQLASDVLSQQLCISIGENSKIH